MKHVTRILGLLALSFTLSSGGALAADKVKPNKAGTNLGPAIRAYLLENPEVVRDALAVLQQREMQAKAQAEKQALAAHRKELIADPDSPVLGNPKGDVTIVEFFDYRCGYCKRAAAAVSELLAKDANVRFVAKEFPILGPDSLLAARSALAAQKQGKYAEFHDALLKGPNVDETSIDALVSELKLDAAKFKADRDDPATSALLDKNYALAGALGINGTPAFIIGDRLVPGAADVATLEGLVRAVRSGQPVKTAQ